MWLRIISVFALTFICFIASYLAPWKILSLKRFWALRCLKVLGYRLQISGESPSWEGPQILLGNHISFLDVLVVIAAHPPVAFLAKAEVRGWPIIGAGAARIGTVFVNRDSKEDRGKAKSQVVQSLHERKSHIVVFPTGTTCLNEELPWKYGPFEIAQDSAVPVTLFSISYQPKRDSAYVDEDTILGQMQKFLNIKNKVVCLHWVKNQKVSDYITDSSQARDVVIEHLRSVGAIQSKGS